MTIADIAELAEADFRRVIFTRAEIELRSHHPFCSREWGRLMDDADRRRLPKLPLEAQMAAMNERARMDAANRATTARLTGRTD